MTLGFICLRLPAFAAGLVLSLTLGNPAKLILLVDGTRSTLTI